MNVHLYTLSTCPHCDKAKRFFVERAIPFESIDYDLADAGTQARIQAEMEEAGSAGFPFARIGRDSVEGFAPERYSELLGG